MKDLFIVWKSGTQSRYSIPDDYDFKAAAAKAQATYSEIKTDDVHVETYLNWNQIAGAVLTSGGSVSAEAEGPIPPSGWGKA